jgi:hypothetical protein
VIKSRGCGTYGERRGVYRVWLGKHEVKRPLGKPRLGGQENIKMDIQEVEWGMDLNDLAYERYRWRALETGVMNIRVP